MVRKNKKMKPLKLKIINRVEILDKVRKVLQTQLGLTEEESLNVKEETILNKELDVDSLDLVEIIMELEEFYEVDIEYTISCEILEKYQTIKCLLDVVEGALTESNTNENVRLNLSNTDSPVEETISLNEFKGKLLSDNELLELYNEFTFNLKLAVLSAQHRKINGLSASSLGKMTGMSEGDILKLERLESINIDMEKLGKFIYKLGYEVEFKPLVKK